jgi:hypothetical protein
MCRFVDRSCPSSQSQAPSRVYHHGTQSAQKRTAGLLTSWPSLPSAEGQVSCCSRNETGRRNEPLWAVALPKPSWLRIGVILPCTIRSYYPIYWYILGILNDSHNSWGFSQFLVHHDRPIIHLLLVWGGAKLEITESFTETLRLVSKDHGNPWKIQRVPQLIWINNCVLHPLSRCFMVFP